MTPLRYMLDDALSPQGLAHLMARVIPRDVVRKIAAAPAIEAERLFRAQMQWTMNGL